MGGAMPYHIRAWSEEGTLLFRDAEEADLLWEKVVDGYPDLDSLSLMPNHFHLMGPRRDEGRLARVEAAFAKARNHRRGEKGRVWAPHPPPEEVPKERIFRVRRYIALNATRKGLVTDPLAWRWCTHRDRMGLTADPVGPLDHDPARHHAYVSSDETVAIGGTPLPVASVALVEWEDIAQAVIEVCRCHPMALRRRGRPRTLWLQAAWILGYRDIQRLRAEIGIGQTQLYEAIRVLPERGAAIPARDLAAVVRVAGDPRFRGLGPLHLLAGWKKYYAHLR
jgi:hypothetical protein